jgi:uncharacterized protein YqgV (UPF0045/DUF77 family)
MELSINPVGGPRFSAEKLSKILRAIGDARLGEKFEASNMRSDGDWEEVMAFAKCCPEAARSVSCQVITTVRIQETTSTGMLSIDESRHEELNGRFDPGPAGSTPGPGARYDKL